jgi:hypothetical protein
MNAFEDLLAAAGRVDDATPEQLHHASVPVHTAVSASTGATPITSRRAHGTLRRNLALTGVAAAVTAGVVTVSVLSLSPSHQAADGPGQPAPTGPGRPAATGSSQPPAYTTAAMLLSAAGKAAGAQPGGWPHAAYWHTVDIAVFKGRTIRSETWAGHYAAGVGTDPFQGPGLHKDTGPAVFGEGLTWDQLYALPTDPAKLGALLEHQVKGYGPDPNPTGGVSAAQEEFVEVGDLLRDTPASPALRKALYDVAAGIPGVRLVGKMKDALGRTGIGVAREGETTLLIDPATGQLLAELAGPGLETITYVSQGPASTAPAPKARG